MLCQIVSDQKVWDDFIAAQPHSQFLQSWSWGEFQKQYGRRVWRVGIFGSCHPFTAFRAGSERSEGSRSSNCEILRRSAPQDDVLVGAAQIIEHYLGLGMGYLYCPRGPLYHVIASPDTTVGAKQSRESWTALVNFIQERIANYGHIFLRVEPTHNIQYLPLRGISRREIISNIQYFRVPSIQPNHTLILDLSKTEEELLAAMHPKTRYNIHLAERKGLEFENVILNGAKRSEESFSQFWSLLQETARRDKIRLHLKKYYEIMLQNVTCYMLHVKCFKNLLAAGLFLGFGDTLAYVHGASSSQHREMMAPHLLHWQAIKFAKKSGYRYYDFGGVNPEDKNNFDYRSSWEGLTRFKKGFGGFVQSYSGTYDLVLNKLGYKLYQLVKKINSWSSNWPS